MSLRAEKHNRYFPPVSETPSGSTSVFPAKTSLFHHFDDSRDVITLRDGNMEPGLPGGPECWVQKYWELRAG